MEQQFSERELSVNRVIRNILFLFILSASVAMAINVYHADGRKMAKVQGLTKIPRIIVDTVRLDTGYAKLELNDFFGDQRHEVAASSTDRLHAVVTPVLDSLTQTIRYYGVKPGDNGRSLEIKSSSNTDSAKVTVIIFLN